MGSDTEITSTSWEVASDGEKKKKKGFHSKKTTRGRRTAPLYARGEGVQERKTRQAQKGTWLATKNYPGGGKWGK